MNDGPERYCRQVEAYLCRKNDGHLIRIVGPAFEQVCGWAAQGVPLNVAYRGIDRYFERYYAKGPRRRPVRIEFCEADVLDVFDEWRRAVGLVGQGEQREQGERSAARPSLPAHLERVIARLTAMRGDCGPALAAIVDDIARELDAARAGAKTLRGEGRRACLERLRTLDSTLLEAVRGGCDPETLHSLAAAADLELAPFRTRLPPDAYGRSRQACLDRLLRERARLPVIAFE
ncbi:MAG: hypothetical protein HY657_09245 [Acidobacteria bacterium]|nr:hypothetical protein [Acidobacteriota bacterium]